MASLTDLGKIANDFNFQNRCIQAAFVAAFVVAKESNGVAGHPARLAYAQNILNGSINSTSLARAILANATIAAEADITQADNGGYAIPDGDIQFTIQDELNILAGVTN